MLGACGLITLLTDFGLEDSYVGMMKGQILKLCPQATLVDLTHQIPPQDVRVAGFQLDQAVDYFPSGSLHLAVVDPGVGTSRAMLAVRTEKAFFVAPDNGLLSRVLARLGPVLEMVQLEVPKFASSTFQGRDVMAPAAGLIASGGSLASLGASCSIYQKLDDDQVLAGPDWVELSVLALDHFGNLTFSFSRSQGEDLFKAGSCWQLEKHRLKMADTYGQVPLGQPLLLWSSANMLELACRQASAAAKFGLNPGAGVRLRRVADASS